jgi:hypothetical protein
MPKLNPILPPLALLLSLCLLTACVTTPLHRFPLEVRNLGNEEIRDLHVRCGLANCIQKKFLGAPATSPNPDQTWTSLQLPLPLPGSLEVSWHSKQAAYHQVLRLPPVFPKRAGHVVAIEIAQGVATLNVDAVASVGKGFR